MVMTSPDTSPTLRIDGCTVCCRQLLPSANARHDPGAPLLLLHGLGCSGDAWKPVVDRLAEDGCAQAVATPDLPGYGDSPCSQGTLSMNALADWTADFMDRIGLAKAHVAGHSMGCQVAMALARRHPERVASLLLVGPTTGRRLVPLWRYAAGLALDGFAESPRYNLTLAHMYAQMGLLRYSATVLHMMHDDPFASAADIPMPSLILRGSHDFVVPARAARALTAVLPQGRYQEVSRAAHALQFGHPGRFLDLAIPFWQGAALVPRRMFTTGAQVVEQAQEKDDTMAVNNQGKIINQHSAERWISAIAGGGLITYGVLKRSPGSLFGAVLGGFMMLRGTTGHCQTYSALGVSTAEDAEPGSGVRHEQGIRVQRSVTIDQPADELFEFWRKFDNLPKFMTHLERVDVLEDDKSHWVAKAPLGKTVEWNARIINEKPGQLIAWQTDPGADVDSAGAVTFKPAPGGRGTEVHVSLSYMPPAGAVGSLVAKLFGEEPSQQIEGDLRRFKMLMETGEIATTEGQSAGKRSIKGAMAQKAEAKIE